MGGWYVGVNDLTSFLFVCLRFCVLFLSCLFCFAAFGGIFQW